MVHSCCSTTSGCFRNAHLNHFEPFVFLRQWRAIYCIWQHLFSWAPFLLSCPILFHTGSQDGCWGEQRDTDGHHPGENMTAAPTSPTQPITIPPSITILQHLLFHLLVHYTINHHLATSYNPMLFMAYLIYWILCTTTVKGFFVLRSVCSNSVWYNKVGQMWTLWNATITLTDFSTPLRKETLDWSVESLQKTNQLLQRFG